MRVGYVFESRFSAGKIQPISMIFGILNLNKVRTLRKCSVFSCRYKNVRDIDICFTKNVSNVETLAQIFL